MKSLLCQISSWSHTSGDENYSQKAISKFSLTLMPLLGNMWRLSQLGTRMHIFIRLSKCKERFIEMKGYTPTVVYLGKQEYDTLADWCKDSLLYELDETSDTRNRIIGLDIYLVDADSHMAMM